MRARLAKCSTIVDTIAYTGLVPGNEYTVSGTLMDKASGEPALDDEGNEITASTTFTADESCGTVDVTFTFAGASLAGKSLVAFETMEFEGAEYMVHADIDDVEQTVSIVDIATQARDAETRTNTGTIGEHVKLIDTVAYTGLAPGSTYKLFTMLMDKATGNPILGDDGLPIVGTTEFVPEDPGRHHRRRGRDRHARARRARHRVLREASQTHRRTSSQPTRT